MNVFNRIVMILAILVALLMTAVLIARPDMVVSVLRNGVDSFDRAIFDDQFVLVFSLTLGVMIIFLVLVLWLELRRPRPKLVRIRTKGGVSAQLGVQSILQSLQNRIDELPGVREVRPRVLSRGRDVDVFVDLDTGPSVNVPALTAQVEELCRDVVEGQLGAKIHGKVRVSIKHEPYPPGAVPSPAGRRERPIPRPMETVPAAPELATPSATSAKKADWLMEEPIPGEAPRSELGEDEANEVAPFGSDDTREGEEA